MLSSLVLGVVLMFAGKDPAVVGTWGMGGVTLMFLKADGTGEMEGESLKWSTDKGVLTVIGPDGEEDKVGYAVKGGKLVLSMDGVPMTLDKLGGGGAEAPAPAKSGAGKTGKTAGVPAGMEGLSPEEVAYLQQLLAANGGQGGAQPNSLGQPNGGNLGGQPQPAKAAPGAQKAGNDELSQFLMRNAWCSFSYNKTSGYSSKSRAQFFPDGTYSLGAQGEGYSSGYGGTMASQHNTGDGGLWKVVNGKLMMSNAETGNQFVELPMQITRNSNGSPIINANGKEYMVCQ